MDAETLKKLAAIAHVGLSEAEAEEILGAMELMERLLDVLDEVPSNNVPVFAPIEISDVLREDAPVQFPSEELVREMKTYEGYVRGPKIA